MSGTAEASAPEGSWIPLIVLSLIALIWWASFSQSQRAVKFRRWYNLQVGYDYLNQSTRSLGNKLNDSFSSHSFLLLLQRVQWKKKLGLRDESKYKDGAAGDGANQRHQRQG
jgi:hypothetical protein